MSAAHDPRPIGVFDSGLGGLTAVRELFRALPSESIVYFGDTARQPYGTKSCETVTRFSTEIAAFLVRQNVKCVLIACNTASSCSLAALSHQLEIPVVGVIGPTAKTAVAASPGGRIGVIGTPATIASEAYPQALAALAPGATVVSRACPLFVPLIEEGWLDHAVTQMVAEEYLAELRAANIESLILGCTHYRLIAPLLARIMGSDVRLIDSGAEAARATAELLETRGQLSSGTPDHHFYLSDERSTFARIARGFLGHELPLTTIVDQNDESWFERLVPERKPGIARR